MWIACPALKNETAGAPPYQHAGKSLLSGLSELRLPAEEGGHTHAAMSSATDVECVSKGCLVVLGGSECKGRGFSGKRTGRTSQQGARPTRVRAGRLGPSRAGACGACRARFGWGASPSPARPPGREVGGLEMRGVWAGRLPLKSLQTWVRLVLLLDAQRQQSLWTDHGGLRSFFFGTLTKCWHGSSRWRRRRHARDPAPLDAPSPSSPRSSFESTDRKYPTSMSTPQSSPLPTTTATPAFSALE